MTSFSTAALRMARTSSLVTAAILLPGFAHAAITGGLDPEVSVSAAGTWLLTVMGAILWTAIFLFRGLQMGLSGRSALPSLGYAVGGVVIFFGAAYWLQKAGLV